MNVLVFFLVHPEQAHFIRAHALRFGVVYQEPELAMVPDPYSADVDH